jgi:hypothetical protein
MILDDGATLSGQTQVILGFIEERDAAPPPSYWNPVPVEGAFPSSFTLDLFTPPPSYNQIHWLGSPTPMAQAYVAVVQVDDNGQPVAMLGMAHSTMVIYVPQAVAADSIIGQFYGPLTAGYHLIQSTFAPLSPDDLARCVHEFTKGTCTETGATSLCETSGVATLREVAAGTPLMIKLDGLPCGPY